MEVILETNDETKQSRILKIMIDTQLKYHHRNYGTKPHFLYLGELEYEALHSNASYPAPGDPAIDELFDGLRVIQVKKKNHLHVA